MARSFNRVGQLPHLYLVHLMASKYQPQKILVTGLRSCLEKELATLDHKTTVAMTRMAKIRKVKERGDRAQVLRIFIQSLRKLT